MEQLMRVKNLQKYYPIKKDNFFQIGTAYVKANKDISIDIYEGETLGIVGESGCGKSTFGRTIIQLQRQTGGATLYYGDTLENLMPRYVKKVYRNLPKLSSSLESERLELERIEDLLLKDQEGDSEALAEDLRLKKIAFEEEYGNTLRLVGGLVIHPDLKRVSQTLLNKYDIASQVASLKRAYQFEKEKAAMHGQDRTADMNALEKEINEASQALLAAEEKVEKLKSEVRQEESYSLYNAHLDSGIDLAALTQAELRVLRKDLQIIFQDPYSSLDPRLTVGDIIGEGLLIHKFFKSKREAGYQEYILDIMEKCGLDRSFINRYPHQFSGGQRQRIGIARALALKPKFIVCDEAVSALDVSIQSQIINLLMDLREEENLTYLFITHDLGVVRFISDRIGVMYFGRLVELGTADQVFNHPIHPYTKQLINAIPSLHELEQKVWDETETYEDFTFLYEREGVHDSDWVEVEPGHFVAATLKHPALAGTKEAC